MTSAKTYQLGQWGWAYLVTISSVGNSVIAATDVYIVVTGIGSGKAGRVVRLTNNISYFSVTLSDTGLLTVSSSSTSSWLAASITKL